MENGQKLDWFEGCAAWIISGVQWEIDSQNKCITLLEDRKVSQKPLCWKVVKILKVINRNRSGAADPCVKEPL